MHSSLESRHLLEVSLRRAIAQREFELHYQPLINIARNAITGFEALLRWRDPARGLVSPGEFIPFAEEKGLIIPLGEWAVRKACADAAKWPGDLSVAVNLSAVQFRNEDIVGHVFRALAESHLQPHRLELEITESVLLKDSSATIATLHKLRQLGVRISMDDFGTGYSSLAYLRSFPFDKIKIDQSFVRDLAEDRGDALAIVRAICALGTAFNVSILADGVETAGQLDCLRREGCTEAQGFLFSRPKPLSDLAEILSNPTSIGPEGPRADNVLPLNVARKFSATNG
jgi:EAL domain-containing protein (putative c-di-GMP-specific phosphodiesterase class I)